jgi:hypothetical protein
MINVDLAGGWRAAATCQAQVFDIAPVTYETLAMI